MGVTPYLVDTNILLRWVKPNTEDFALVVSAIGVVLQRGAALCYTSQNVSKFWNTCTRPLSRNGYGLTPHEADVLARRFEGRLTILPDDYAVHLEWRKLVVTHEVSGVQVHDARLVASMRVHGITRILTFNDRDFARYRDIEAIHPRNVSATIP